MNKLSKTKRAQILNMLVEGSSIRATSRVAGVSYNSVLKLLVEAGKVCSQFHDETVQNVQSRRVECDEVWAFCYAKAKKAPKVKGNPDYAGDVWTWKALDSDTKLIITWLVSTGRDAEYALELMDDLRSRLANRVQLSTDGHRAYLEAVEGAFGGDVDYAQLVKIYGTEDKSGKVVETIATPISGAPDPDKICTSYVERANLSTRMSVRRFTRLTNAFTKKLENHGHSLALWFVYYNFIRRHRTLKMTPAMAAGLADEPRSFEWLVDLIDAANAPKRRGPYKPRQKVGV